MTSTETQLHFDEIPVVDFSLEQTNPDVYYAQLKYALEDVGFAMFVNVPGFEKEFQTEMLSMSRALFAKPQEWKEDFGVDRSLALRGYMRSDTSSNELWRFGPEQPAPTAPDGSEVPFYRKLSEGPNQWPPETDLPHFRERLETLWERFYKLSSTLNNHVCKLLDLPQGTLDEYYQPDVRQLITGLWRYLAPSKELRQKALEQGYVEGLHEHRDPGQFLTFLIQDRPGLEVLNHQGKWILIPEIDGGVIVNIGMPLMRLTGGKLVATTHRVNTFLLEQDRYTIPYSVCPRLERTIAPLPQFAAGAAKVHAQPDPRVLKLNGIEDPLVRGGYARLSFFPAAAKRLYPKEYKDMQELGIL